MTATMLFASAVILAGGRLSRAQDSTPNPAMLLNLDLFAPQTDSHPAGNRRGGSGAGGDSMMEQIRALRAMGYLTNDGPLPSDSPDLDEANGAAMRGGRNPGGQQ